MANNGAGETYKAWLVKKNEITVVDSMIKTSSTEEVVIYNQLKPFKYRYLTASEMTTQPISDWLKGKFENVLFTSETNMGFEERDAILFEDGTMLRVLKVRPQVQHGMFLVNKRIPNILELQ